jgi:hypothetical protein
MEFLTIEFGAELVDEVVIGEIFDEATSKDNCAVIWAECMTVESAPGLKEVSKFQRPVQEQSHVLFLELKELTATDISGGFHIHKIPAIEPPDQSPYRKTAAECEEYKKQTTEVLEQRKIGSSHVAHASPVLCVLNPGGKLWTFIGYWALNKIAIKDQFPLPHL